MMIRTTAIVVLSLLLTSVCQGREQVIWKVGKADGTCSEFALAPDSCGYYVERGFGTERQAWIAGVHRERDFPYVLAGPLSEWAGYSYWAGWAMCRQTIFFQVENVDADALYALHVDLLDVSPDEQMVLRVEVNDKSYDAPLSPGRNAYSVEGSTDDLSPETLRFDIPGSELRNGLNCIGMRLLRGRYVLFDALRFEGPSSTRLVSPRQQMLLSAQPAGYDRMVDGKRTGTLLLDVRNLGSTRELDITFGRLRVRKRAEAGHTCFELDVPAVRRPRNQSLRVVSDGEVLFDEVVRMEPGRLAGTIDYVDQFAGSSGSRWMIGPGPWMPFGMVKIMPDNEDQRWKAGYEYQIENIMGFSHIHEWTMCGLLTMPTTGPLKITEGRDAYPDEGYRSRIDKRSECARVGYYAVDLTDYDIRAELTATTRCSFQRYTFPESDSSRILLDLYFPSEYAWTLRDAEVKAVSDREIVGWSHNFCNSTGYHGEQDYTLYFVMQFDTPFDRFGGWIGEQVFRNVDRIGRDLVAEANPDGALGDAGAFVELATQVGKAVCVRTGISLVSVENARENLETEVVRPFDWDFEAVVDAQRETWQRLFDRVDIKTDDRLLKQKFYTNLYRAITPRTIWNDCNGQWRDMDERVQTIAESGRDMYGSDAYWGMHWNLVPFYNILYPEYMTNWLYTFSEMYRIGGWLPIGNPGVEYFRVMVGAPAVPMVAAAYQHGIRDFDTGLLAKAIRHELTANPEWYPGGGQVGNEDYPDYIRLGYVPYYRRARPNPALHSYVSNTMEYAFQDYAAGQYFKALGMDSDAALFMRRSGNWRNIFDAESGFVRPRDEEGAFWEPFDPFNGGGFCEGSAWQYTWYVPHDVPGLVSAMGNDRFVDRLEWGMKQSEGFSFNALGDRMADYPINHGNETNMQAAYLFNFTDAPWLTQKWARAIQELYYGMGPRDAYPGDEDQGQMSAWYVLSSMGLFEMDGGCAVEPMVEFGSPRFDEVTIQLSDTYHGGKTLRIVAHDVSRKNCYIRSVRFNGIDIHEPRIAWNELKKGGVLEFWMDSVPAPDWWSAK